MKSRIDKDVARGETSASNDHHPLSAKPRPAEADTAVAKTGLEDKFGDTRQSAFGQAGTEAWRQTIGIKDMPTTLPILALDFSSIQLEATKDKHLSKALTADDLHSLSPDAQSLIGMAKGKIELPGYPNGSREYVQFTNDVKTFEDNAKKNGLSSDEVFTTIKDVGRILSSVGQEASGSTADGVRSERQRVRVAEQPMNMIARPEDRNQGNFDTCAMAAVEGMLLTGPNAEPSKLSKMVADVTLTGRTNVNGIETKVDSESLRSHGEHADNREVGQDKQRLAENIFRLSAANLYYGMRRAEGDPEGQLSYVSRQGGDYIKYTPDPAGGLKHSAELAKNNDPANRDTTAGAASTFPAISRILNKITGKDYHERIITNSAENLPEGKQWITEFSNSKQFDDHLRDLKTRGQYPVVMDVFEARKRFTNGESPFNIIDDAQNKVEFNSSMDKVSNLYSGRHALLVADRQEDSAGGVTYILKNTWGKEFKAEISKDELYASTTRPPASQIVDDLAEWRKARPPEDRQAMMHDGRYAAGLVASSAVLVDGALNPPTPLPPDYVKENKAAARKLKDEMRHLPAGPRRFVQDLLHDKEQVSKKELDEWNSLSE